MLQFSLILYTEGKFPFSFAMQPTVDKSKLMKKRIPTIVGLGILVVGLVVGVIFLGTGPGVFAPRATPETTPSQIKLTNVTDSGFTVSFFTAESTPGFVKYGTEVNAIKSQTGDDRDQLSGTVGSYQLHHITVRGLKPSTNYYYLIGTGTNASFDNNGAPFTVKTTEKGGAPSAAKTAYGNILSAAGNPVNGAIVYVSMPEVGEMSSLTKASGGWAIPLSNARKADGSGYAIITESDMLTILAQGLKANETSNVTVSVAESQPVADITLGQNQVAEKAPVASDSADTTLPESTGSGSLENTVAQFRDTLADASSSANTFELADNLGVTKVSGGLDSLGVLESSGSSSVAEASEEATVVLDLQGTSGQVVNTQTPTIAGKAVPNVVVSIEVHSDTQITQQLKADENGYFSLDIEALKQNLEPGEHTATYSYVDPTTGQTVTKTVTFTVEPKTTTTGTGGTTQFTPYGSGNPYSLDSTKSATSTSSATSTASATTSTSTRSAQVGTKSAIPVSGSVGTTMALVLGGMFFIMAGGWSYYLATQIDSKEI